MRWFWAVSVGAGLVVGCGSEEEGMGLPVKVADAGDAQTASTADGGTGDGAVPPNDAAADVVVDAPPPVVYSGEATWYDAHSANACGLSLSGSDYLVAAMNGDQYKKSLCGKCAHVKGPKGEVTVRIVDLCPGCSMGDLDLSEEAFAEISPLSAGRVKITWSYADCP
jgi:expansin